MGCRVPTSLIHHCLALGRWGLRGCVEMATTYVAQASILIQSIPTDFDGTTERYHYIDIASSPVRRNVHIDVRPSRHLRPDQRDPSGCVSFGPRRNDFDLADYHASYRSYTYSPMFPPALKRRLSV
jgi:hypothetical protein